MPTSPCPEISERSLDDNVVLLSGFKTIAEEGICLRENNCRTRWNLRSFADVHFLGSS